MVAFGRFDPLDDGGIHALIRRFRAGDAETLAAAVAASADVVQATIEDANGLVIVPVPGHEAGVHRGPRLALAQALAAAIDGVAPDPPPLSRRAAIPSARSGPPRDAAAEAAGLAWDDALEPGAHVLLVDDVLASGATLAAAITAVRRAAPRRVVHALVLAIAEPGGAR